MLHNLEDKFIKPKNAMFEESSSHGRDKNGQFSEWNAKFIEVYNIGLKLFSVQFPKVNFDTFSFIRILYLCKTDFV
jgi:hypothetical protein